MRRTRGCRRGVPSSGLPSAGARRPGPTPAAMLRQTTSTAVEAARCPTVVLSCKRLSC
jgi:hypothetical protein